MKVAVRLFVISVFGFAASCGTKVLNPDQASSGGDPTPPVLKTLQFDFAPYIPTDGDGTENVVVKGCIKSAILLKEKALPEDLSADQKVVLPVDYGMVEIRDLEVIQSMGILQAPIGTYYGIAFVMTDTCNQNASVSLANEILQEPLVSTDQHMMLFSGTFYVRETAYIHGNQTEYLCNERVFEASDGSPDYQVDHYFLLNANIMLTNGKQVSSTDQFETFLETSLMGEVYSRCKRSFESRDL